MKGPERFSQIEETPLSGVRQEFRTALREEVEAAKRGGTNTIRLHNGRRIREIGAEHQYLFLAENVLTLPVDTPGILSLPENGLQSPATVVSIHGLAITISLRENLGPFVPEAHLQWDVTFLLLRLIERIEEFATRTNAGGERILGSVGPSRLHHSADPSKIDLSGLDEDKRFAVSTCLGSDTAFIWGPPGTGKTHAIGALGEILFRQDRSMLLVSHTNVAVDQALERIAKRLKDKDYETGLILRIGKVSRIENKLLLLDYQVERRSMALAERRTQLESEKGRLIQESIRLQRTIEICEWVHEASEDILKMYDDLVVVTSLEADWRTHLHEYERGRHRNPLLKETIEEAKRAVTLEAGIAADSQRLSVLEREVETYASSLLRTREQLDSAIELLSQAEKAEALRVEVGRLPRRHEVIGQLNVLQNSVKELDRRKTKVEVELSEAEQLLQRASSVGAITRAWRRLPNPKLQASLIDRNRNEMHEVVATIHALEGERAATERLLLSIDNLEVQLAPYRSVPSAETQRVAVSVLTRKLEVIDEDLKRCHSEISLCQRVLMKGRTEVAEFQCKHGKNPNAVLEAATLLSERLDALDERIRSIRREALRRRQSLEDHLTECLSTLRAWSLAEGEQANAEEMFAAIQQAHASATVAVQGLDALQLKTERDHLSRQLRGIDAELTEIAQQLESVEEMLIKEARIVGMTLTSAYLRDAIQSRRFDTVVLDEASMAPMPALWVAAGLADSRVIAVGDFNQLPPIVQSQHPLAKKWLGRDVFEEAGIKRAFESLDSPPTHCAKLLRQHRMHPQISAIPNELFYRGDLEDAGTVSLDDPRFLSWYRSDWGYDSPVLLVDTGSLNAWVTSVPRGRRGASRLNFLSATVCVDLAEQLLASTRPPPPDVMDPRILIVSPYRAHAKLLELIIRDQQLDKEVRAGTVHTFQGSEADVVILDLVNDEPHWRVRMFTPGEEPEQDTRRLINVAVTRARRRLIIVGDFQYAARCARKAFLGRQFLPFLLGRYPLVDADQVVQGVLSARAAKAHAAVFGGSVESEWARTEVTQEHFFPLLLHDMERARSRIVIYSPFITADRLAYLEVPLKAAIERGVRVYVVTKPGKDRSTSERAKYRRLEQFLSESGICVVHKRNMHEKFVFVDEEILWSGSLNPLSFSDKTQEWMERRESQDVAQDIGKTIRLEDLLKAYDTGNLTCPICSAEVVATEGNEEPFYWRCVNDDCYTRSIDDRPFTDGVIRCSTCTGEVEYGQWGKQPTWRCKANRHHHQRLAKSHLRLPKMRARIAKAELRKLDKQFGVGDASPSRASDPTLF
jgi:hypothetical protein